MGKMAQKSKNKPKTTSDLEPKIGPKKKSKKVKNPSHVHVSFFLLPAE